MHHHRTDRVMAQVQDHNEYRPTAQAIEQYMPLKKFAAKVGRTANCVYRWKSKGVLNPQTRERVRLKMTWTSNGWAVSAEQYNEFIAELNQRL